MRLLLPTLALSLIGCIASPTEHNNALHAQIGGPCDGCELFHEGYPGIADLGQVLQISTQNEPGEPMIIEGIVLLPDGSSPAKNVVLYVYHTDATGLYSPSDGQTEGRRHGHLRGWVKTGTNGRYTVKSVRPAPYPDGTLPAHIHIFVKEPDKEVYYIDEVRFLNDPLLTKEEIDRSEGRGGDLNITLINDRSGTWKGELQITLGKSIPAYR